ncbi:MAG TPA: O-antigen ligase family protein [Pyrinomonadaceae bacterium]|nr:O-antigen ligase family protein [Pyrinomonadaceae bacterium]
MAIFVALLALIIISAIPYGTVEPWWKSAFICVIFMICVLAIIEDSRIGADPVLVPMLAISALAFVQSLSTQISEDPFQSAFFALQMLALTAFLALLYRYANTARRIRILVYTILGIAVISAIFGILRQTTQHETGFILPLLRPNQGYAQFINKNHFAYLMEMAFGLGVGMILGGGVKRDRLLIYVALLLPILAGLALANSRGGILAILVQIVTAALLFPSPSKKITPFVAIKAVLILAIVNMLGAAFWAAHSSTLEGASRSEIWRATLKMFAANPILGVGLGGYWIGITAYHEASGRLVPQEAHNEYLELLSSGGVIGFAIGVWFVVIVVRMIRRNLFADRGFLRAARIGAVLGLAGVAAHSLVDFGLHIMVNAIVFVTLIMIATTNKVVDLNPQEQ